MLGFSGGGAGEGLDVDGQHERSPFPAVRGTQPEQDLYGLLADGFRLDQLVQVEEHVAEHWGLQAEDVLVRRGGQTADAGADDDRVVSFTGTGVRAGPRVGLRW